MPEHDQGSPEPDTPAPVSRSETQGAVEPPPPATSIPATSIPATAGRPETPAATGSTPDDPDRRAFERVDSAYKLAAFVMSDDGRIKRFVTGVVTVTASALVLLVVLSLLGYFMSPLLALLARGLGTLGGLVLGSATVVGVAARRVKKRKGRQ